MTISNKTTAEWIALCEAYAASSAVTQSDRRDAFEGLAHHLRVLNGANAALGHLVRERTEERDTFQRALALALGIETPTSEAAEAYIVDWQSRADEEQAERSR